MCSCTMYDKLAKYILLLIEEYTFEFFFTKVDYNFWFRQHKKKEYGKIKNFKKELRRKL
jgi:hypothetical protein